MTDLKDKNILYLTHSYHSFQKDQIEILAKSFKQVYVLVRYKPIAELANILPINFLKLHTKKYVFSLRNLPANVKVIPVPLWYLPTNRGYKHLGDQQFQAVLKIIKRLDIKFDIIHSHFLWTSGYVGAKLKEIYKTPLVITGHSPLDIIELPYIDSGWDNYIKWIIKNANIIISVNNRLIDVYKQLYPDVRVTKISYGYKPELFYVKDKNQCRNQLNLPLDSKIVFTIGTLDENKAHRYLISAIKTIREKQKDVICIIIGNGVLKNKLQKLVNSLDLQNIVTLPGLKPHNEIVDWMNACDIFVLPSFSESCGVVQIEALACGKPVVATYNGGSDEIITSEDVGFLCQTGNTVDLTEKLNKALNKKWDTAKILDFASNLTWEKACNKILETYKNL